MTKDSWTSSPFRVIALAHPWSAGTGTNSSAGGRRGGCFWHSENRGLEEPGHHGLLGVRERQINFSRQDTFGHGGQFQCQGILAGVDLLVQFRAHLPALDNLSATGGIVGGHLPALAFKGVALLRRKVDPDLLVKPP